MVRGFVYVIESPLDTDLLDGRTEGRSLCEALHLAEIPYWYSLVTTPETFTESLGQRLLNALSQFHDRLPIIHLSMHGNNDGVFLTNHWFLSWEDLRKALAPLMNEMRGTLLICMSSCFGSAGCRMAMHAEIEQQLFGALVGNSGTVLWSDAGIAYITFYHLLFKGVSVEECVNRMNLASGDGNFKIFLGQAVKQDWENNIKVRLEQLREAVRASSTRNTGKLPNDLFTQKS